MTDYQQRQVRDFRRKGVGYRAIAAVVGVSRDEVRNYCKSRGLDGLGGEVMARDKIERYCQQCHKILPAQNVGRRRKFCLMRVGRNGGLLTRRRLRVQIKPPIRLSAATVGRLFRPTETRNANTATPLAMSETDSGGMKKVANHINLKRR